MFKKFSGRIIAYNIAIFLVFFSFILFATVQGSLSYYVLKAQEKLTALGNDAVLTVNETLLLYHIDADPGKSFSDNASFFHKKISEQSDLAPVIFDQQGNPLIKASDDTPDFSSLLEQTNDQTPAMMMFSEDNSIPTMLYLTKIINNDKIIGAIGLYYSLESSASVIDQSIIFCLLGFFFILPFLLLLSARLSKQMTRPLENITSTVEIINAGAHDLRIEYSKEDEIGDLSKAVNQMVDTANKSINQIESERTRLANVLASLDDGVLAVDRGGEIIMINQYIQTYLNVSSLKSIYDFQYQSFMRYAFDELRGGKPHVSFEIECNDRNLLIIGSPLREDVTEENYLIIIRNITAEHQIQKEQNKFISSVSHELRTPLTTIIGYTDMLTRRNITESSIIQRSLTTINHEGHRLLRLVDDLINVNQLDHFEFAYHKTNLDLNHLLTEIVEQMNIKANSKNININFKADEALPELFGDYDRLSQLFINIIHNAVKYSNNGDVIDVVTALEDDNIVVSVRDYGIGIAESEQKKVFAAFYRVDEDRTRNENEGGAGLGLFLVKQIVDNHQGTIDVQSVLGEGTIFMITFPVNVPAQGGSVNEETD